MLSVEESISSSITLYHEEASPWWTPALIFFFPLYPSFRKYHVTLTKTTLEFGYVHGWTKKQVERSQIESVDLVVDPPISGLWQWGGYGIRGKLSSSPLVWLETGYVYKDGPGLRIKVKGASGSVSIYTFNTDEPEKLKELLDVMDNAVTAE